MFSGLTKMTPHFPDSKKYFCQTAGKCEKSCRRSNLNTSFSGLTFPETQYFSRHSSCPDLKTKNNYFSLTLSKKFDNLHLVDKNEKNNILKANTTLAACCLTIDLTHPTDSSTRQPSSARYALAL